MLTQERTQLELSYPRPQFKRREWLDLNGTWAFEFDREDKGVKEKWFKGRTLTQSIQVPFCFQSPLSGIKENEAKAPIVWYQKQVKLKERESNGEKILLHFEAVDYYTMVWINGEFIGEHRGGFVPFSFTIDECEVDELTITIRVEDHTSCTQPLGKQSWKEENFLCWYTKTTGIWQSVWLEYVSDCYLKDVKVTPNIDTCEVHIEALIEGLTRQDAMIQVEISLSEETIQKASAMIVNNKVNLCLNVSSTSPDFRLAYWTPDEPNLYDITYTLIVDNKVHDRVESYFGMRKISIHNKDILLNNERFYQKLILDQGYYGEGLMTPGTIEMLESDLRKVKEMGFNGVRRHQTVADHRYMYLCDKLGLVMWAEMPSPFEYGDEMVANVTYEYQKMIKKHYNHPSVIAYTAMNESWGVNEIYSNQQQQSFVNALYYLTKALDKTRLVIGNDGWEHTLTDILTIHDYSQSSENLKNNYGDNEATKNGAPSVTSKKYNFSNGYSYQEQPIMLSEFGGIAYTTDKASEGDWGYGNRPRSKEEALRRFEELVYEVMKNDTFCGFCYTQLTDVEQEINGLLDSDHNYKFDPADIRRILNSFQTGGFIFE
ncbi:glycoside hydrolase family 2 [Anaerobacillus alkalilacustris]|uniref:Glycoside hydrolase family 2 n=1 Tax=Anaerobacillus alkalilacustris TaxID=393763 RepID=A0A1S2LYR7_9BACI|nr:glycoside hydrolase family 2 [Anaerobacillus alkalilacustris]OIJ17424.1 glycoside hydrolase family 2 [Anaerobacillus alkalilacustris]